VIVGGLHLYEVHGSHLVPFAEPAEVRAEADPLHPLYIGTGVQSMCADEQNFLWIQGATSLFCLNPNWPADNIISHIRRLHRSANRTIYFKTSSGVCGSWKSTAGTTACQSV